MNNNFKKSYCAASVIFAIAVVLLTIFSMVSGQHTVYAADADTVFDMPDPEDITGFADQDNPVSDAQADAADNTTNGFSIIYSNESGSLSTPVRMLIVLTVLSLAPSLMIMLTSFTKIIIVLHFVRTAIGTQTTPPNQVMIGLALFLTFFIMWPTFSAVNTNAIQPLDAGEITQAEAIEAAEEPFREFMSGQTRTKELDLFIDISGETYESYDDVPFTTLVPAFILSQLREAFIMGFLIYIPFIVIDMVVASVLMSMGMMMLPPTTISLPFKILLFILADGWNLVIESLVKTFY